jgi:adenosylcobinamide kinase / adenosylcobinamide-phosphate guanylyltransferase
LAKITLVTGGARSGKSRHAQALAESLPGRRVFIATCPVTDEEMRERIMRHQEDRKRGKWQTIEAPMDLDYAIRTATGYGVVLVDCLTLWVNNLMYQAEQTGGEVSEDEVARQSQKLLDACAKLDCDVIFVTNEVGLGIVPDNAMARRYRDLVGRCNQIIAAGADVVTLVTCGIPTNIKEGQ